MYVRDTMERRLEQTRSSHEGEFSCHVKQEGSELQYVLEGKRMIFG